MILIEHGTIITVDRQRRVLTDGSILVDGREILAVGPAREVRPPRPADRVIDARTSVVLPGFVDTHVHLSEHLNRGLMPDDVPVDRYLPDWLLPLYSVMTSEDEQYAALLACTEMVRTGTTTFCEAGTLFDVPAVAEAVDRIGMRAVLGRWTWDRNNLVYAATGASVRTVIIDGRVVLDEGRLLTVDERSIYERVEALAREQVRRAGLRVETAWPLLS